MNDIAEILSKVLLNTITVTLKIWEIKCVNKKESSYSLWYPSWTSCYKPDYDYIKHNIYVVICGKYFVMFNQIMVTTKMIKLMTLAY